MRPTLFVGEKPSRTAHEKGWTWKDRRLAGKTLGDALDVVGLPETQRFFVNLYGDNWMNTHIPRPLVVGYIRTVNQQEWRVVALGERVSRHLAMNSISHVKLRHPAARGAGRARQAYIDHVKEALG